MNVSHMSATLQAKAYADAAAYNEDKAKLKTQKMLTTPDFFHSVGLQQQIMAHNQFARECREECRRLQQSTQSRPLKVG